MEADHETRRKIIREWMALPKDKRQTEEQVAAFAKKAAEQNKFHRSRRDPNVKFRRDPFEEGHGMAVVARRQVNNSFGVRVDYLLAKDSSRVLDPHFVGDARFGQAHELGERCMRPARAAGQRWDQARDRSVAVSVERAQVNVPRGAARRAIDP